MSDEILFFKIVNMFSLRRCFVCLTANKCYSIYGGRIPADRKDFASAQTACRAIGPNTDLASITNRQELGKCVGTCCRLGIDVYTSNTHLGSIGIHFIVVWPKRSCDVHVSAYLISVARTHV